MTNPVAIGGVGGSGTRAVAQLLAQAGYFMGADLNSAYDNLWFTMLFKRPRWFKTLHQRADTQPIFETLKIFYKIMQKQALNAEDLSVIQAIIDEEELRTVSTPLKDDAPAWYQERLQSILHTTQLPGNQNTRWGWKEPNTHIYLPWLSQHNPDLKYIHVIRHGLDIAYSGNQNQLRNWGYLVNLEFPYGHRRLIPMVSLDLWIQFNQRAITLGQEFFGENFLLVYFEALCENPVHEIETIMNFLGVSTPDIASLSALVHPPDTLERYRERNLTIFRPDQLAEVENLGFTIKPPR